MKKHGILILLAVIGLAFLALARLFSHEMEFDPQERAKLQEVMLQDISDALTRGLKRIEKNPRDSEAYLAMALAKIAQTEAKKYLKTPYEPRPKGPPP